MVNKEYQISSIHGQLNMETVVMFLNVMDMEVILLAATSTRSSIVAANSFSNQEFPAREISRRDDLAIVVSSMSRHKDIRVHLTSSQVWKYLAAPGWAIICMGRSVIFPMNRRTSLITSASESQSSLPFLLLALLS